jgi:hypothetical protein
MILDQSQLLEREIKPDDPGLSIVSGSQASMRGTRIDDTYLGDAYGVTVEMIADARFTDPVDIPAHLRNEWHALKMG